MLCPSGTGVPGVPQPQGCGSRAASLGVILAEMGVPGGWVSPKGEDTPCDPLLSPCSGQKYLTAVVKLFGPLTRNYYIRAILHAA